MDSSALGAPDTDVHRHSFGIMPRISVEIIYHFSWRTPYQSFPLRISQQFQQHRSSLEGRILSRALHRRAEKRTPAGTPEMGIGVGCDGVQSAKFRACQARARSEEHTS